MTRSRITVQIYKLYHGDSCLTLWLHQETLRRSNQRRYHYRKRLISVMPHRPVKTKYNATIL